MKAIIVLLIIVCFSMASVNDVCAVDSGEDTSAEREGITQQEETGERETEFDEIDDTENDENDTSKIKKVGKKISTIPEATGNVFLEGFDKVGNWIEEKSGNRFETKWNPQRADDPSLSPEHYGFEKDPAKGI